MVIGKLQWIMGIVGIDTDGETHGLEMEQTKRTDADAESNEQILVSHGHGEIIENAQSPNYPSNGIVLGLYQCSS